MGTMTYDQEGNVIDEPSSYGGLSLPPAVPTSATPIPAQKSPAEIATRLAEWNKAFDTMRSDSAINAGLLRIGTQLMQPIPVGQNATGHVGQAVQAGFDTMNAKKTADFNLGMKMEEQSRAQQAAQLEETRLADSLKTSAAARDRAAVRDPLELQQLQGAVKKLDDELALARAQEKAGLRTSAHLAKIADLEMRTKEGKIALDKAHAGAFDSTAAWNTARGDAAGTPKSGKQIVSSTTTKLQDGTEQREIVTMVNGRAFHTTIVPPAFSDPEAARKQAETEISNKTTILPWKDNGYTGTRQEAIERRTKELITPRRAVTELETGRPVDPKEYDAMGTDAPTPSNGAPKVDREALKVEVERLRAEQKAHMKANNGERSDALDSQLFEAMQRAHGKVMGTPSTYTEDAVMPGGPTAASTPGAIKMEPGPDGVYRPVGATAPKSGAPTSSNSSYPPMNNAFSRGAPMTLPTVDPVAQAFATAAAKGVDLTGQTVRLRYLKQQILTGRLTQQERSQALMTLKSVPGAFTPEEIAKLRAAR